MKKKILIVGTDENYSKSLKDNLRENGYEIDVKKNIFEGIEKILVHNNYNLIILEAEKVTANDASFLSYIKTIQTHIKTLMLTEKMTEDAEMLLLENNIDIYKTKNTSYSIINKCIEKLLINMDTGISSVLQSKSRDIIVDTARMSVTKNDQIVALTYKEYSILKYFILNADTAVSREELISQFWEKREQVSTRLVDVHVKNIRKKLNTKAIVSIRGYGYRWDD